MKVLLPYLKALYSAATAFVGLVVQAYASSANHTISSSSWWIAAAGALSAFGVVWGVPNVSSVAGVDVGKLVKSLAAAVQTSEAKPPSATK